ncbi:MAG: hypothetical protein KAX19_03530, partial [Candidatus Brocadiae bacterium]|nr:hypothetical protein [Candidatus Brocadiia bacterium]
MAATCVLAALACGLLRQAAAQEDADTVLPEGVKAVWDLGKAFRQATPTRERICINGLWRWQPAGDVAGTVPEGGWGYFKVPGSWPGITSYIQKDTQTLFSHPRWQDVDPAGVTAAWYQREIEVPGDWQGRRITFYTEYLNSHATVFVDGRKAGEVLFPGGEVDITSACRPGDAHVLSLCVEALPLADVVAVFSDTGAPRQGRGRVARRGLCGDAFLVSTPAGPRIGHVKVSTSVRNWEITFDVALDDLQADTTYRLRARITEDGAVVKEVLSDPFTAADLSDARFSFTEGWRPDRLWDVHTPQNTYDVQVALVDAGGDVLDLSHPERFGFREFWIDG